MGWDGVPPDVGVWIMARGTHRRCCAARRGVRPPAPQQGWRAPRRAGLEGRQLGGKPGSPTTDKSIHPLRARRRWVQRMAPCLPGGSDAPCASFPAPVPHRAWRWAAGCRIRCAALQGRRLCRSSPAAPQICDHPGEMRVVCVWGVGVGGGRARSRAQGAWRLAGRPGKPRPPGTAPSQAGTHNR